MPLIVMIGCCIAFGVQPFGDNSLLIIDGLHQYMPFYSILYDKLKSGGSLFYSFRAGLGINFLSLYAYYLSSPLNLLILFFKVNPFNYYCVKGCNQRTDSRNLLFVKEQETRAPCFNDFYGICFIELYGWLLLECYVA